MFTDCFPLFYAGDKFLAGSSGCVLNTRKLFQNGTHKFVNGSVSATGRCWEELSKHKQPIATDHWSQTLHLNKLQRHSVVCIEEADDDSESLDGCHGDGDSISSTTECSHDLQSAASVSFVKHFRKRAVSVDCSETMIEKQQDHSGSYRCVGNRMVGRKRSWSLSHLDSWDKAQGFCRKVVKEAPASTCK